MSQNLIQTTHEKNLLELAIKATDPDTPESMIHFTLSSKVIIKDTLW